MVKQKLRDKNIIDSSKLAGQRKRNIFTAVQILLICVWVLNLWGTDSYYSVYLLGALAGIVCTAINSYRNTGIYRHPHIAVLVFSIWLSSTTVLANYPLFIVKPVVKRYISMLFSVLGGSIAAFHVMQFSVATIPLKLKTREKPKCSWKIFLSCFLAIETLFLIYLLGAAYPAYFTPDVFNSMHQIRDGVYVNNNPFWYTISIKWIAGIGYRLLGSANAATAFYVFIQGIFMAAVFSYVLVTFYQIGIPKWVIGITAVVYGLLPYNLAYSATMLKDIPFSVAALFFVTALYRILRRIGNKQWLNYCCFAVGAFIFCLMRTNGWVSFLITGCVILILLRRTRKRALKILILCILIVAWILTNPLLSIMNVGTTDFVEGLAVPFQQIARVITNGYALDAHDRELLDRIFYVDLIPEIFMHQSVDPIKGLGFRQDQREYLKNNLDTYVSLWIRLGLKHPGEYLKAWIELTKGYWNSGYRYWIYYLGGGNSAFGISRPDTMPLRELFGRYFEIVESSVITQPLYSIGVHVWLLFGCFVLNLRNKRSELLLTIPGIVLILGLWLGTPVYSEFRYAYPIILSLPLILCVTVYHAKET